MELTLNILLDELSDCNPLCYIKDKSRAFTGVRLISPNPEKNRRDANQVLSRANRGRLLWETTPPHTIATWGGRKTVPRTSEKAPKDVYFFVQ